MPKDEGRAAGRVGSLTCRGNDGLACLTTRSGVYSSSAPKVGEAHCEAFDQGAALFRDATCNLALCARYARRLRGAAALAALGIRRRDRVLARQRVARGASARSFHGRSILHQLEAIHASPSGPSQGHPHPVAAWVFGQPQLPLRAPSQAQDRPSATALPPPRSLHSS